MTFHETKNFLKLCLKDYICLFFSGSKLWKYCKISLEVFAVWFSKYKLCLWKISSISIIDVILISVVYKYFNVVLYSQILLKVTNPKTRRTNHYLVAVKGKQKVRFLIPTVTQQRKVKEMIADGTQSIIRWISIEEVIWIERVCTEQLRKKVIICKIKN